MRSDLQVKYPENFFLLRGITNVLQSIEYMAFYDECKRRYNVRLWKIFTDCFNCLPVAALVDEEGVDPSCKCFAKCLHVHQC